MPRKRVSEKAADRIEYRLTFGRTEEPRSFDREIITGPRLPDAVNEGQTSTGDWHCFITPPDIYKRPTVNHWIESYFEGAIQEAIHEVLEWFKVDGERFMDPHNFGTETQIMEEVNTMVGKLLQLRKRHCRS